MTWVKKVLGFVAALILANDLALANRVLSQNEILDILGTLTSQPRDAWLSVGTVLARHTEYQPARITDPAELERQIAQETLDYINNPNKPEVDADLQKMRLEAMPFNVRYKYGNEFTMTTDEEVRYDGSRYYWDIEVTRRNDSIMPPNNSTFMYEFFDLEANGRRTYVWDGEKHTEYSRPIKMAATFVTGSRNSSLLGSPLSAGIIPWGYGVYTFDELKKTTLSAVQVDNGGHSEIQLNVLYANGLSLYMVLETALQYAVSDCMITLPGGAIVLQSYDNFELINSQYIPKTIHIERHDASSRLVAREDWEFTTINTQVPSAEAFKVVLENKTTVEHHSPLYSHTLRYEVTASDGADISPDTLLNERLALVTNQSDTLRNCATLSLKYAAKRLGRSFSDQQLAAIVSGPNHRSSLYALRNVARGLGLNAKAVKTNFKQLKQLRQSGNLQAILHIPGQDHFVLLGGFDSEGVQIIDLTSDLFLYHRELGQLGADWAEGVALLVSNDAINGPNELNDTELLTITGGAGYSCSVLLQSEHVVFCPIPVGGMCNGNYEQWYERWGCGSAPTGSCSRVKKERYISWPCIIDPLNPSACMTAGTGTKYYMLACG